MNRQSGLRDREAGRQTDRQTDIGKVTLDDVEVDMTSSHSN